jgi:hypothetical protein
MSHRHRLHAGERRLGRRVGRAEEPLEAHPARPLRHREDAADPPQAPVERELPDGRVLLERSARHLAGRRQDGEGDREVEAGSLLPQLGGSEIDGDPAPGELELGRRDPAAHAFARLLAGAVGEAHDRERRQAVLDVRLDLDPAGLEADERVRDRACEHVSTVRAQP